LPELLPKRGLCVGRKHVEPQVGGADRVGFLDEELAARVPSRRGARERERDQETQQGEHRAVHHADLGPRPLGARRAPPTGPPAELQEEEHADEHGASQRRSQK
jgi:hypothetical protein